MRSVPLRLLASAVAMFAIVSGCSCNNAPPATNQPPIVTLTSPAEGAQFRAGEGIALAATALDPEDGSLDGAQVVWTSSVAGQLATGAAGNATLNDVGDHVLTVTATDKAGMSGSASVNIRIIPANAPNVAIEKPVAGQSVNRNQVIEFKCNATTVSGGAIPDANISWSSALSGALPSGANMTAALTVSGNDTITCTALDSAANVSASATVNVTVNQTNAPTVQITQPQGSVIWVKPNGTGNFSPNVNFTATAQDFNVGGGAGNLSSAIVWTLNPGAISLGTGATASHTFSTVGDYTVTASATDSQNATATDVVTIHVVTNIPPQCAITRPDKDNAIIPPNTPYQLQGFCFDPETNTQLPPTWTSSAQTGNLGTGNSITATFTVTGAQTLTASAVDPTDSTLTGSFSRPIRVIINTAPTGCVITAPAASAVMNPGATVTLTGSATDAEDPVSALNFRWVSNQDGTLANGANTTTVDLVTPGQHTLTMTATDPGGLTCQATVTITVNGAPTVQISSLQQGTTNCLNTSCVETTDISASGTATDPQGIASSSWSDSLQGSFGTGTMATLAAPIPGKHMIMFSATDTLGAIGTDARQITILPANKTTLASALFNNQGPVESMANGLAAGDILWVDGNASSLRKWNDPAGAGAPQTLPDPGLSVFVQTGTSPVTFVGTDGSGVTRCVSGTCTSYKDGPLAGGGNVVTSLAVASAADLLVMGTDLGLALAKASDPANGSGNTTVVGKRILDNASIRQVAISPASTASSVKFYAATDVGLAEVTVTINTPFDPASVSTQVTMHTRPSIPDNDVFSVAVSPEDKAFAGTKQGFSELNGTGPSLTNAPWNFPDEEIRALLFERRTINSASHDILWAGTRNGLIRYDLQIKVPSRLSTADGLPSNDIRSLLLGPGGVKYVGTALGIAKYDGP